MFPPLSRTLAFLLLILPAPLAAQGAPIAAEDMMRHIRILASDAFQGRAPGSEGERLATQYIVAQLQARGLEPAAENGSWFQPLHLVERVPGESRVAFIARGTAVAVAATDLGLLGREASESVRDAPVVFAGYGVQAPDRHVDQLAGADLRGAVVLILGASPRVEGFPPLRERVAGLFRAGAAAVIAIAPADFPWDMFRQGFARGATRADDEATPELSGIMRREAAQSLFDAAGVDFARLLGDEPGPAFRAVTLPARASLDVATAVSRFTTNNVIGRLRGSGATGENVLFLAHWDHLGFCRPPGARDRICNGAVDNASGVAMLIEIAGHLAQGPRPVRDVLVMATTAEEEGELGADWFATHPVVPPDSIVAAINMDTVAVAPAGEPVAILNRSVPSLNAAVAATAAAMGRRMDEAHEADEMAGRQDGAALARHGLPAIMVGGSFASMQRLNAFLNGRYHQPSDQADASIEMGGATEDANLLVALARRLADPALFPGPAGARP
jgi:Zn-dependent M28 family amino/carboxypeptidase